MRPYKPMFKQLIIILIILGFLVPVLGLGQQAPNQIEAPKTIEEAEKMAREAITVAEKELPGILERIWRDEVMPVWGNMWEWVKPRIKSIWQRVQELLGREIEKRKPIIEEELQREKQELKKEAPEIGRPLWERFKELLR